MFKCGNCKRNSKPAEKMNLVITKVRPVTYEIIFKETNELSKSSNGFEIMKTVPMCKECASLSGNSVELAKEAESLNKTPSILRKFFIEREKRFNRFDTPEEP